MADRAPALSADSLASVQRDVRRKLVELLDGGVQDDVLPECARRAPAR